MKHFIQGVLCKADFWLMHSLCCCPGWWDWPETTHQGFSTRAGGERGEWSFRIRYFFFSFSRDDQLLLGHQREPCCASEEHKIYETLTSTLHLSCFLCLCFVLFYDRFTRPFFLLLASCRSFALVLALALYLFLPYPFHVLLSITPGFLFTSHALCAGGCWLGLGSSIYGGVLRAADGMGSRRERGAVSSSCGLRIDDFQWKASALLTRGLHLVPCLRYTGIYVCIIIL